MLTYYEKKLLIYAANWAKDLELFSLFQISCGILCMFEPFLVFMMFDYFHMNDVEEYIMSELSNVYELEL